MHTHRHISAWQQPLFDVSKRLDAHGFFRNKLIHTAQHRLQACCNLFTLPPFCSQLSHCALRICICTCMCVCLSSVAHTRIALCIATSFLSRRFALKSDTMLLGNICAHMNVCICLPYIFSYARRTHKTSMHRNIFAIQLSHPQSTNTAFACMHVCIRVCMYA